jgi:hypothetical protein
VSNPQQSIVAMVAKSRHMMALRSRVNVMQYHRRRLSTVGGPAAWVAFKAMYEGEVDAKRKALADEIRGLRRQAGVGVAKPEWVAQ